MEQTDLGFGGAQAVLNLQPSSSIGVAYHPFFGTHDDLMLLEIDEELLPDVFNQRVTLRGQPDEDAVLCTQSKTYAIKFVGTSNSAFLIPQSDQFVLNSQDFQDEKRLALVIKVAPGNMELVEVSPRLDKLRLLLSENPYSLLEVNEMEEFENETNRNGLYSWDDLINRVQASDDELRIGLEALSAVEIDGYWRIIDEKSMGEILKKVLDKSISNNWSLNALNEYEVLSSLLESDGIPYKLGRHCLNVYCTKIDKGIGSSYSWKLDEKRVCVHFAREVLRTGKKKLENFRDEWFRLIPNGIEASFEMLEGEVLTERLGVETWVRALRASSLPSTPAERFSILFRERTKWEWKDLHPYISGALLKVEGSTRSLCKFREAVDFLGQVQLPGDAFGDLNVPGLSSEALLLKYTRRTQPKLDAEPVFSAR